jgi:hypothetical protein
LCGELLDGLEDMPSVIIMICQRLRISGVYIERQKELWLGQLTLAFKI